MVCRVVNVYHNKSRKLGTTRALQRVRSGKKSDVKSFPYVNQQVSRLGLSSFCHVLAKCAKCAKHHTPKVPC